MANEYQKIKINAKITLIESEVLLLETKIDNFQKELKKINESFNINISNDEEKIRNCLVQIGEINEKIENINKKINQKEMQLKKNPISIESELDKERAIFINETQRICRKRDDIDTELIEYEKNIYENIYEVKTQISNKHDLIKDLKLNLNEIKLKNLEERKKILLLLSQQKENRKKNKQEIDNIVSLISKKQESLYKYKSKIIDIPNQKRQANTNFQNIKLIIDKKKDECNNISDKLLKSYKNKDLSDEEKNTFVIHRDTLKEEISKLESKSEFKIYENYKFIEKKKEEIKEDIQIIENEIKELYKYKNEISNELYKTHNFKQELISEYKIIKDKINKSNLSIINYETKISNFEKDLVIFQMSKEQEMETLMRDEDRSNLRWKIINERINNYYKRESNDIEYEHSNLVNVKIVLQEELGTLKKFKNDIDKLIKDKLSNKDEEKKYYNSLRIQTEINKLKKKFEKKKNDINTYQNILSSL